MEDKKNLASARRDPVGVAIGIFLVVAGALTLAEHAGILPDLKWGLPIFWMIIGGVVIYGSVSRR